MRIEKFEDLAVAIDDKIAIWFRKCGTHHLKDDGNIKKHLHMQIEFTDIEWVFLGANENSHRWKTKEDFEVIHPGMLNDILRRLNDE